MRKILLATTALIGSVVITTGAIAEKPQLSISGRMTQGLQFQNDDAIAANTGSTVAGAAAGTAPTGTRLFEPGHNQGWTAGQTNFASELYFKAKSVTDDGMEYGANYDIRPLGGSVAIDEGYVYFSGERWGEIRIGQDDDANIAMFLGAVNGQRGLGGLDGSDGLATGNGGTTFGAATGVYSAVSSGDNNKVGYYSPNLGGFKFGVSIAPSGASYQAATGVDVADNGTITAVGAENVTYRNIISGAAVFSHSFDQFSFAVEGAFTSASSEDANRVESVNNVVVPVQYEDANTYKIGGSISVAGLTLGATYGDDGDAGTRKNSARDTTSANSNNVTEGGDWYALGLGYDFGNGGISIGYFESERDAGRRENKSVTDEGKFYVLAADTVIADGLTAFAEVYFSEVERGQYARKAGDLDTESTRVYIGTTVSF
ncbi:MAG: porin [Pseudomonadota bacterium]